MSPQLWPGPGRMSHMLSLIRGVAAAGYAGPSVTLSDGMVTITARVNNGNGLTLSTSFQEIAVLPEWAWPDGDVIDAATSATATGSALVWISTGSLRVASTSTSVAFSLTYPI